MWEPNGERRDSGVGSRPRRYAGPLRPQSLTVMVAQGDHREHARVCQKVNATWHGFRYVYSELGGDPYRAVESRPCQMRSMNFWRFPANGFSAKFREWSRLGSPAFRAHEWHDPTKDGNYDSGDGEQAANFIQDMVIDGILIPVAKEKVEVMIRSQQAAINPIATIPKATPGQFRFLIDSRRAGTNWMLAKMPSHFPEPLHAIHCVVPKGGYTFSSDMRDCFFSFPLNEQDSWLFVVEFRGEFYRYGQLAQGSKTSPHACLGFGYAQIELFRDQRGCHQVIEQLPGAKSFDVSVPAVQFVDDNGRIDAIGGGRTFEETHDLMRDYHRFTGGIGINAKWSKLVPPTQTDVDYGGFGLDSRDQALEVRLKPAAQEQLHAAALGALTASSNPARSLARLAGLSERAFLLNRAYRAWLSRYYGFASRVKGQWGISLVMQTEERKDVRQIVAVAGADKCFARHAKSELVVTMGDASGIRAGGAVRYSDGDVTAWTGTFPQRVVEKFGANVKELRRLLMQMQRHVSDEAAGQGHRRLRFGHLWLG